MTSSPQTLPIENHGYCPICEAPATFVETGPWLRDEYLCSGCRSIPRQRSLVRVLTMLRPDWRTLEIHESSPLPDFLARQCPHYSCSYYLEGVAPGTTRDGLRCENLEALTFPDASFDVVVTQDVLEHVFHPDRAMAEIARVLRPDGLHIFTTPKHGQLEASRVRARIAAGNQIEHLLEAQYHGAALGGGSLVTWDYGRDFEDLIELWTGYLASTYVIRDRTFGIDGEFLEIFVMIKSPANHVAPSR